MTFNNRLLQMEWMFYEKGMQSVWNELRRFAQSTVATNFTTTGGITLGTSKFGDIDLANVNAVAPTAGQPTTGAPIPIGDQAPGWGFGQQHVPGTNTRPPTLDQP
jgi:hypothetical protein